jgi:hypothetical protein
VNQIGAKLCAQTKTDVQSECTIGVDAIIAIGQVRRDSIEKAGKVECDLET